MAWQKGQSGNPGGRPRETPETAQIRALARQNAPAAFAVVLATMASADKDSTRLAAARTVLELAGVTKALEVVVSDQRDERPFSDTPTEELLRLVSAGDAQ